MIPDWLADWLPDEDHPAGPEYLALGVVAIVLGAFMLHLYFDRSGRSKPFAYKLLPGT